MSIYVAGIDTSKACVLVALESIFGDTIDWGKEFLIDYYKEFNQVGLDVNHLYLVEECAPVLQLPNTWLTFSYQSNEQYFTIYSRVDNVRYRVLAKSKVMLVYKRPDGILHATAIPASEIGIYLQLYTYVTLFVQKYGLIIDTLAYEEPF